MTVNGKSAKADESGYVILDGVWKTGDEISLKIEKKIRTHELNGKIAVSSGAIVLALDERNQDINVKLSSNIVKAKKTETRFKSLESYCITFDNGVSANFVDFASAGSEWDKDKSNITVWIDKE